MATKEYFVKMSWQDPKQPLRRIHDNNTLDLDLTQAAYEVANDARIIHCGHYEEVDDFTIDFMIPTGRGDDMS